MIVASFDFISLLYMLYVGPGAAVELVTKVVINGHLEQMRRHEEIFMLC